MSERYYRASDGSVYRGTRLPDAVPVVVIDPDDQEAIFRLYDAYREALKLPASHWAKRSDALRTALRRFTDPNPPEPTGLGAAVRVRLGGRFVRVHPRSDEPRVWQSISGDRHYYVDLDVVEVLSEGVED